MYRWGAAMPLLLDIRSVHSESAPLVLLPLLHIKMVIIGCIYMITNDNH